MVKHKESESESDDTSPANEPRFRVRVCMQRFYNSSDVRARAYVCVSPRRRVRWLQRRLRRLFALPRLRLLSRGHLLPPQEPLALLQPDDPVECVHNESSELHRHHRPLLLISLLLCRVVPADANSDDAAAPRNDVGSVEEVPVFTVESRRSPSPVHLDDLTETKRQALMMLEQFCAAPATAACAADSVAESAPRPRRRRVRRRRRVPPPPGADDSRSGDAPDSVSECRDPEEMVVRNELQPRAPRVVRPLPDGMTATLRDTSPTDILIR